jgi:inorganic phosphate transporter, PiT family
VDANLVLLVLAAVAIAFANGANDNFKGVATLFGSGIANYRRALMWGTATTMAGSLAGLLLAGSLLARFSGRGLVPESVTANPAFLTAVGGGAAATVLLATVMGFPISTTHALTGALVGAGVFAAQGELDIAALGTSFVAPLLMSPIVAALVMAALHGATSRFRSRPTTEDACLCFASRQPAVEGPAASHAASPLVVELTPVVASVRECAVHGLNPAVMTSTMLDGAHYLSAGAVGFARGVNDTPKLLALLLPAQALMPLSVAVPLLAGMMALGGLVAARRVAETMSHRVTAMTPRQGFLANVTTASLVLVASRLGLPVSTTHVSTGSLFGLGMATGGAHWRTIAQIVLAWIVTLPCAAACAALVWWFVG